VISPLLLNVALHGLEAAAGVRYTPDGMRTSGRAVPGSPVVVRYADDLVALCGSAEQAQQVKDTLIGWLAAPRVGLQRGQDACRHPRRRLRFPRVQHSPLPQRQAADQTQ
jgi:RNA-directed DNA polymerase